VITILIITITLLSFTGLKDRVGLLKTRTAGTIERLYSDSQIMGHKIALNKLKSGGMKSWLAGFGGFATIRPSGPKGIEYDINSPILVIYRYGIIGSIILLFLLTSAFKLSWLIFKNVPMIPEELAVVFGVFFYLTFNISGAFIRGTDLVNDFTFLSWFVILLSWMWVIYRDSAVYTNSART